MISLERRDYTTIKRLASFEDTYFNHSALVIEDDFSGYEVTSSKILLAGDCVLFSNRKFIVSKAVSQMIGAQLISTYTLIPSNGIGKALIENVKIKGASLEGKVTQVKDTSVQVQLSIDSQKKVMNWYQFITPSSNFMYSMPYIGETVKVYFPSTYEDEAIANLPKKNFK